MGFALAQQFQVMLLLQTGLTDFSDFAIAGDEALPVELAFLFHL